MKKILLTFLATIGILGFAGVALAVPYYRTEQTIIPFADNAWDLGTSTKAWRDVYMYNLHFSTTTSGCLQSTSGSIFVTGTACGTGGGGGSAFPFTPTTNYGALTNATATPIWFQAGLQASSTSYLVNASTTQLTVSNTAYFPNSSKWTSTGIILGGDLTFTQSGSGVRTITTQSGSTQDIKIVIPDESFVTPGNFSVLGGNDLEGLNPGSSIIFTPGTGSIDGNIIANYNISGATNVGLFSIATVTPHAQLSIQANTSSYAALAVGNSASTTFVVHNNTNVGVGTTTPGVKFAVNGSGLFSSNLTVSGTGFFTTASTTNLTISSAPNCSSTSALTTNASGVVACGAISGSGGAAFPFTPATNYGVNTSATSTALWAQAGLFASSTSHFVDFDAIRSTTTSATTTSFAVLGTASTSALIISNMATIPCSGTRALQTTSAGLVTCGNIGTLAFAFTPATNYGVNTSATGTPIWAQAGLFASSTSHFVNFDATAGTTTNATSTSLYSTVLGVNSEYFTDLTGAGLTISSNTLTVDVTGDWTGTIDGNNFGGGAIGQGDLLYGSAAGTISELAKDTNATRYLSNTGASNNPAWAQIALTTGVTGTLPVGNGGTGQSSFGQGWLHSDGTTITSSTSPTVNYVTATSTTATSNFPLLSVATGLTIPQGSNPTVDAIGKIAFDTTDNQFVVGTSTSFAAAFPTVVKLWSATVASTSLDFISGGRIPLPPQRDGIVITEIDCFVDGGTSKIINVDTLAGGANTDSVTCGTSNTTDSAMSANYNIAAGTAMALEFGTVSGAVDYVTFSIWGTVVRE